MEERKHIVILAAGDFPTHHIPLQALREADFVVCCDGAYSGMKNEGLGTKDCVVIGDGDSLPEQDKLLLGDRFIHVAEQDYNDLHKAMNWVSSEFGVQSLELSECGSINSELRTPNSELVTILGATGKREDHTLGNISYLITFAEEHPGIDLEMLTDHGRFSAFRGRRTFASFPGQQVSVFAADPTMPFSGSGLQYPLEEMKATRWWQATLNAALGDSFELRSDGWLIVFQTYQRP